MERTDYAGALLGISMSLVFLYFGFSQLISPEDWIGFIPESLTGIASAYTWVMLNSVLELTLGTYLLLGLYTRFSALILGVHLLFITIDVGFNPVGARDFGLAMATLALLLLPATYGLDKLFNKKVS